MPSPMILVIVFAAIGISLLISGGIVISSIKKLSGDDTAKKNIENVGIIMNIIPGLVAMMFAGYFFHKARQPGIYSEVSPLLASLIAIASGVCLIISGGIISGSIGKLSGDDTAKANIKNVGVWMNLVPGIVIVLATAGLFVKDYNNLVSCTLAASPKSP